MDLEFRLGFRSSNGVLGVILGALTTTEEGYNNSLFFALIALLSAIEASAIVSLWLL
jgi:hypothetical protein